MAPDEGLGEGGSGGNPIDSILSEGEAAETFDNLDYESPASKKVGEDHKETFKDKIEKSKKMKEGTKTEEEKEDKKTEKKEDEKKSDIDTLKDKEDGEDDKKKVDKKEEKKEEKKLEEKELTEEEKATEAKDKDAKKLKIRMSDGLYAIEPDSKVRVKIDGKYEEVPMQEIINNYSGKVAYDKKFTELGESKKTVEAQTAEFNKKSQILSSLVADITKNVMDPNANIWDSIYSLVEKSGGDVYTAKRRAMESVLDEIEKIQDMSESELKAYWLTEKDSLRTKQDEARTKSYNEHQANLQAVQKVDSLRQALGVSEEQYVKALDDLEAQGIKTEKWSDEKVVEYASLKPHIDSVQGILEPFESHIEDAMYEDIVQDFAKSLRNKRLTVEQITEIAKKEFMDEDVKDLSSRTKTINKIGKEAPKTPTKLEYESFADFDN